MNLTMPPKPVCGYNQEPSYYISWDYYFTRKYLVDAKPKEIKAECVYKDEYIEEMNKKDWNKKFL